MSNAIMQKWLMVLVLAGGVVAPARAFVRGRSFLMPRSQSAHAERELVGWQDTINLPVLDDQCDCCYGSFAFNPGYSRSFRPCDVTDYFFGTSSLVFSGSSVADRGERDILADYFGLPTDFQSCVHFCPLVQNVFVDLNFFAGLDALCAGLYFRAHVPFVHTSWNMRINECVIEPGVNGHLEGYMASGKISRDDLACNVTDWFRGCVQFGDVEPLAFGKINGPQSEGGLSDIQVALGWDPFITEDYHFGVNLRTAIPTGGKSKSIYLFEPLIGNGRHRELGFGLSGHTKCFESRNGVHQFLVYGDLNATHLFGSCHRRSFDFRQNGPGSRYILIEQIGTPIVDGLGFGDIDDDTFVPATQQYHGKVMPAINQTTLDIDISIALQVDIVLKLTYRYKDFSFDFGYNFWGRTAERADCRQSFPENSFAIKGDAQLYGFGELERIKFVGLNATQSQATLHQGQGDGNTNFVNANADNAAIIVMVIDKTGTPETIDLNQHETGAVQAVNGSKQSVFITDCDIDNLSALAPAAYTHTLFTHFNYHWTNTTYVEPYIGFGAEVSVDGSTGKRKTALSEWAVWMKVGFAC